MNVRPTVLIIEDDPVLQMVANLSLRDLAVDVCIAPNGQKALEKIGEHDPSLILTDVQLPVLTGIEIAELVRIKERETGKHVPIIGVSADPDWYQKALLSGMDAFVLKPANYKQIVEFWLLEKNQDIIDRLRRSRGH